MSNDLISRKATINAICESGVREERKGHLSMAMVTAKQWAVDTIESVPSAQPDISDDLEAAYAHGWTDAEAHYHEMMAIIKSKLNQIDRLYMTVDGKEIQVVPLWNVNKILENAQPERKTGKWIIIDGDDSGSRSWIEFQCPNCKDTFGLESGQYDWYSELPIPWKACPMCGSKMEVKQDEL